MSNIEPTPFGDKYLLVEHIATGGMAEIYRAQYAGIEGFAKELVVKTLRAEFAAREEVVGMFLDEARVAATLTHNNVVHTYDLGEIEGEYFIAMEYLKGEELVNVLRRAHQLGRPIPLETALGVIMQSCEGLHYVHTRSDDSGRSQGLVHRDINPTNIHVGYDGMCKILDFGIAATRASAVAKKGQVAGKLSYMAPEQLRGMVIDHRADIFPLGVVLYEMCLGRRLFRGQREEVTRRVLEGEIPPPTFVDPSFPPALEAVIMKALEVDPADRYQNCDHMFRDLEAFMQEASIASTPRKVSAMMVELFGEGAPAVVNYDDEYDDLKDEALDFDAFERLEQPPDGDEAPAWARGLEASNAGSTPKKRRQALTIGNLEALVGGKLLDESGPQPVVGAAATPKADPEGGKRSNRGAASSSSGAATAAPGDSAKPPREETARRRRQTGHFDSTASGRHRLVTTGALAVAPDAVSGRTFGHSVVSEQKKGASGWGWMVALLAILGLGYFAYSIFTAK